jgi:hypothetical protein
MAAGHGHSLRRTTTGTERTQARGGHLRPDTRPQFRTLGLGPVGEKSGWAASPLGCWACKAPLAGVGEGSISIRRWVDRLQGVAEAGALMGQSGSVRALP